MPNFYGNYSYIKVSGGTLLAFELDDSIATYVPIIDRGTFGVKEFRRSSNFGVIYAPAQNSSTNITGLDDNNKLWTLTLEFNGDDVISTLSIAGVGSKQSTSSGGLSNRYIPAGTPLPVYLTRISGDSGKIAVIIGGNWAWTGQYLADGSFYNGVTGGKRTDPPPPVQPDIGTTVSQFISDYSGKRDGYCVEDWSNTSVIIEAIGPYDYSSALYSLGIVALWNDPLGIYIDEGLVNSDPFNPGGDSGEGGGEGDFDNTGDDIDFPVPPTMSAVDTGFITLFNPSLTELRSLASYMWSNLFDIATLKKLFADPMNCILGLSIVPVNVPAGASIPVNVGNISTGVSMTTAASQYVTVDCGTLNINEYWGAYLDYSPYTKAELYLPYCGIHPINIDDIMGKAVHIKYNVDILSGACCAMVKCGGSVLYSYIGQCAASIPISGNDWSTVINGVISAATAVGSMVATGGASAPLVMPGLASTAVNSMKPSVERSGAMGGTGGMMGIQKPYIVLTRPNQALPKEQNKYTGYPSFITEDLKSLTGYTEVELIHLEGVPATDSELSEIETILKSGVIF